MHKVPLRASHPDATNRSAIAYRGTQEPLRPLQSQQKRIRHSARHDVIHKPHTMGARIADIVCQAMGSWTFVILQSVIVFVWILLNLYFISRPFDPYPFILLNLAFSTQAAYASPLILMSQNRQAAKDHIRDDLTASEVREILEKLNQLT